MAGHSKWANIKHRKGVQDQKKSKVFSRHAKLITVAARLGGGDLEMNPSLRMMIQKARKDNMPNEKIERAVKVGTGEIKVDDMSEIIYEGYGPGGVAIMVIATTNNNNRTLANIRTIFNKNGGSLGTSGSVSYLFQYKGFFVFPQQNFEAIESCAILNGAEDIVQEEDQIIVTCDVVDYGPMLRAFYENNFEPQESELRYIPLNLVSVSTEIQEKNLKIIELLEDDEDIDSVAYNLSFELNE